MSDLKPIRCLISHVIKLNFSPCKYIRKYKVTYVEIVISLRKNGLLFFFSAVFFACDFFPLEALVNSDGGFMFYNCLLYNT